MTLSIVLFFTEAFSRRCSALLACLVSLAIGEDGCECLAMMVSRIGLTVLRYVPSYTTQELKVSMSFGRPSTEP